MKKIVLVLLIILSIIIIGCSETITIDEVETFDEKIDDGTVDIDGILYEIDKTTIYRFKYSGEDIVERSIEHSDSDKSRTEYHYEENLLVKEEQYRNDSLIFTKYYIYDDKKEIETKSVSSDDGKVFSETRTTYGDESKVVKHYISDMNLTSVEKFKLNDAGQTIEKEVELTGSDIILNWKYSYEDDNLSSAQVASKKIGNSDYYYEYNILNDLISEYQIKQGDKIEMVAKFYENKYDDELRLIQQTIYEVKSEIEEYPTNLQ